MITTSKTAMAIMLTACSILAAELHASPSNNGSKTISAAKAVATDDWSMYRADAARSGYTSNKLPA